MKLINQSFEILEQNPGLEGIYEQIELAGRTCYKSQRKEGTTAKDFVDKMIASKHYAMLEHGTVYLKFSTKVDDFGREVCTWFPKGNYPSNQYSKVVSVIEELEPITDWQKELCDKMHITHNYITTNLRVLVENGWLDDLQYLCEPTEYHEKRVTVRFTTSNGIMREFTRHRVFSFAVESTRYCNYSKDKFNKELTFIIPSWSDLREGRISYYRDTRPMGDSLSYIDDGLPVKDSYPKMQGILLSWQIAENMYLNSIGYRLTAQQAREVLPLATKCDMVMTGFVSDWRNVCRLRTSIAATGQPHPDMKALMDPLYQEFISRSYMEPLV